MEGSGRGVVMKHHFMCECGESFVGTIQEARGRCWFVECAPYEKDSNIGLVVCPVCFREDNEDRYDINN